MSISTYEDVMELFDRQMNIVDLKLSTSFRRWADARDETISIFSSRTGIPKDHFDQRLLDRQIKRLTN